MPRHPFTTEDFVIIYETADSVVDAAFTISMLRGRKATPEHVESTALRLRKAGVALKYLGTASLRLRVCRDAERHPAAKGQSD